MRVRQIFAVAVLVMGIAVTTFWAWRTVTSQWPIHGVAESGSAGVGAVSFGISEAAIESLLLGIPVALAFRFTRPTGRTDWLRGLRLAIVVLAAVLVALVVVGEFETKFAALSLLFLLVPFYMFGALALRLIAPGAPKPPVA